MRVFRSSLILVTSPLFEEIRDSKPTYACCVQSSLMEEFSYAARVDSSRPHAM